MDRHQQCICQNHAGELGKIINNGGTCPYAAKADVGSGAEQTSEGRAGAGWEK